MAFITTGLTNGGLTSFYQVEYDDSLSQADGKDRANAFIAVCDGDFNIMSNWFGGISLTETLPITIQLNPGSYAGASWGPPIVVTPGNGQPVDLVRYLVVSEVTEMFMLAKANGWGYSYGDSNEGSKGEALSRYLGHLFLTTAGLNTGVLSSGGSTFLVSNGWLNSTRQDFVNNNPDDNHPDATTGCTTLFLYYLKTQLGFSLSSIINAGAATLNEVYNTLTGDPGNPFPIFKQLVDNAFPGTSIFTGGPNQDDPFPLGLSAFWVDKSSFGKDEVQDTIDHNGGWFRNAFWIVIDGFNKNTFDSFGVTISPFTGAFAAIPGITISQSANPVNFEITDNPNIPQRIRIAFDIKFTNASIADFPTSGTEEMDLNAFLTVGGNELINTQCTTVFELGAGADPYFTNINPAQNNVFWLSQDLRVFTATPALNNTPVNGGPVFGTDSISGGFNYIQQLIGHLNSNYSDPDGTDPFIANILPGQDAAYTGDSSVTPYSFDFTNPFDPHFYSNYNFAIARVRLRGTSASGGANNVKVFFRLWSSQTADTDYQTSTTYASNFTGSNPQSPLPGAGNTTIPFFATGNFDSNTDYGVGNANEKNISLADGDNVWTYFGCFLNLYDPLNKVNGQQIQTLLNGPHHCLVAQIAYDDAPIVNTANVTQSPENCDKLAQRNLQLTYSDNPGSPAAHRIPQTFDARPSRPLVPVVGSLLNYPDELMIDWGDTPVGSTANIYWPQANAADIIALASSLYGTHLLSAADPNTIQCTVVAGTTYVPIPPDAGDNLAGLFTVDLPTTVVAGQEFNIVVRRISSRQVSRQRLNAFAAAPPAPVIPTPLVTPADDDGDGGDHDKDTSPLLVQDGPVKNYFGNWRYVTGTFQVKIPVTTKEVMLFPEENTLAIMKWRLLNMSPAYRWYPVIARYILYIAARIDGLGGNSASIAPSPNGVVPVGATNNGGNGGGNPKGDCECEGKRNKCLSKLVIALIPWIAFWVLAIVAVIFVTGLIPSKILAFVLLVIALAAILLIAVKMIKEAWDNCE